MRILLTGLITVFFWIVSQHPAAGQNQLRTIRNQAFRPGEKLNFRIHYGFVDAGTATLEVAPEVRKIGPRECYHIVGSGRSAGAFDWFFKVRDRYESFTDREALIPWLFLRKIEEGGYKKDQRVIFNHYRDSVSSEKSTIFMPKNTQDIISAFYYARTIDFSNSKPGDVFPITGYLDDQLLPLNIKYIGKEVITTSFGLFSCIVLRPMLQQGRIFKDEEDMTVWVSDDLNRVPVRIQSNILVGSIKMDLTGYENLMNTPALKAK